MFAFIRKLRSGNRYGIPEDMVQKMAVNPNPHTPDMAVLSQRKHNLVFVYGNDMSTGRAALPGVHKLPYDVFTEDSFVMVKVKEKEKVYPAVVSPPPGIVGGTFKRLPKARVKGELYQLTDSEVAELDVQYENGVLFDRVRVRLRVEHCAITSHDHGPLTSVEHVTSGPMYYMKRVWMYQGKFDFINYSKIEPTSINLLKERPDNTEYEPRYYYSPQDWR